jgi:hypothetical protein
MTDQPTSGPTEAPTPADAPAKPSGPQWLSYREAGERLGLDGAAVAARARRGRWPKRRRNEPPNAVEILVPAELLERGPQLPQERDSRPAPDQEAPNVGDAVRAAVAPLQTMLEAANVERRELQAQAEALRERISASQLAIAQVRGDLQAERVKREGAEATATDLRQQLANVTTRLDRLQADARAKAEAPPRRRWWRF